MPFRSKAQQRFMFAAEDRGEVDPGTADRWADETPNIKGLPEKVKKKKASTKMATNFLRAPLGPSLKVKKEREKGERYRHTVKAGPDKGKETWVYKNLLDPRRFAKNGSPEKKDGEKKAMEVLGLKIAELSPEEQSILMAQAQQEGRPERATDPLKWHEQARMPGLGVLGGGVGAGVGAALGERVSPRLRIPAALLGGLTGLAGGAVGGAATLPESVQTRLMLEGLEKQKMDPAARLDYLRQAQGKEGSFKQTCYQLGNTEALTRLGISHD